MALRFSHPLEVLHPRQPKLGGGDMIRVLSHLLAEKIQLAGGRRKKLLRKGRQEGPQCETTGFETTVKEECEEGSEVECRKVNVTMYRVELGNRCKTMFDQKCNVTYKDVPTEKCSPYLRNR